jgi:hypothetical protein
MKTNTYKIYAKMHYTKREGVCYIPMRAKEWQEVLYIAKKWYPSGWFDSVVYADRSYEKVSNCAVVYVFNK